jgi:hypothetical protein
MGPREGAALTPEKGFVLGPNIRNDYHGLDNH